jgi:hypothetical protein
MKESANLLVKKELDVRTGRRNDRGLTTTNEKVLSIKGTFRFSSDGSGNRTINDDWVMERTYTMNEETKDIDRSKSPVTLSLFKDIQNIPVENGVLAP